MYYLYIKCVHVRQWIMGMDNSSVLLIDVSMISYECVFILSSYYVSDVKC